MTLKATLLYYLLAGVLSILQQAFCPVSIQFHFLTIFSTMSMSSPSLFTTLKPPWSKVRFPSAAPWINPLTLPTSALPTSFPYFILLFIYLDSNFADVKD
ncbi:hypothetical protein IHE45_06G047500 [Dioscorea alata]|uniref:Uncharacterized protein n=1 Tax=Dioscorea alata TaxID=55571 RepID=A0ACB7VWG8_DIOAL|nr:hypothetical protein IHE45_06G047500 [Dioscorea alata]